MTARHPYEGAIAVLATKHGKGRLIAPVMRERLGMQVVEAAVDTDQFGTFAGDRPRVEPPVPTAIAKARLGMQRSGIPMGLASEGTIGPDPVALFFTTDTEVLVLVDDERGMVVWEEFRSPAIRAASAMVGPEDDLEELLGRAGFPAHRLICQPSSATRPVHKGIDSLVELRQAIAACAEASSDGLARVGSDFRAQCSPSRQLIIKQVAVRLAERLATLCPQCEAPGWGRIGSLRGLPCRWCATWVDDALRGFVFGCACCGSTVDEAADREFVDPDRCPNCNP